MSFESLEATPVATGCGTIPVLGGEDSLICLEPFFWGEDSFELDFFCQRETNIIRLQIYHEGALTLGSGLL